MAYKIAELNLNSGRNNTLGDVFVAQPDAVKENLAGKLFLVLELPDKRQDSLKVVNFLSDRLNFNYYQNDKIILRERLSTVKVEHIFEMALAKTNKQFQEFLKDQKIKLEAGQISATAGVVWGDEVYVSNAGRNKALLVYRKPGEDGAGGHAAGADDYRVADIAKPGKEEGAAERSGLFSSVISGRIPPKSALVIANEALPEYLSQKQLIEIVSTLPPGGAVEQIKSLISRVNSYVPFVGLVVKSTAAERLPAPAKARTGTSDSVATLNATEDKTEALLSPSRLFDWRGWLGKKERAGGPAGNQAALRLELRDRVYFQKRTSSLFKKAATAAGALFAWVANLGGQLVRLAGRPDKLAAAKETPRALARMGRAWLAAADQRLGGKAKVLMAIGLAVVLFLSYNIWSQRRESARERAEAKYQELAREIERKQMQAEANLLYSNDEGAQRLFEEIGALMKEMPQVSEEQKGKFVELEKRLEEQVEKTRKVERADGADEVADFARLGQRADPANLAISPDGRTVYAADSDDKSVYIVDLADRAVTTAATLMEGIERLDSPAWLGEQSLLYLDQGGLVEYNAQNQGFARVSANFLAQDSFLIALDTYAGRVYLLNPSQRQVYRYNRGGNALSSPYAWVQGNANLDGAVDLAIDGNVHVLLKDGSVKQFLRGSETDFRLEQAEPPLQEPSRIATTPDGDHLYVLEPGGRRVLAYDKKGQFIRQYYADKFNDLLDIAVDEKAKKAYVLNGTKLYSFGLTHLE